MTATDIEQLPLREPETVPSVIHIQPTRSWLNINFREVWKSRELLYFLTWREIKVRYKQTALGAAWAILQPLLTMLVFSIVFGRLAKIPSDGVPYPLFAYVGLVPWMFFSNGLTQASNSLVGSSHLISKVYFPRLIIPISTVLSGVVDLALAFSVLIAMMAYYHVVPNLNCVYLPLFVLLALSTALGVGLWLSALNVQYRDVRYAVPFMVQFWMYATPIAYPSSFLKEPWHTIYGLNPMAGVVEGFRWALLGSHTKPGPMVLVSAAASGMLLLSGAFYFRRLERKFADIV